MIEVDKVLQNTKTMTVNPVQIGCDACETNSIIADSEISLYSDAAH